MLFFGAISREIQLSGVIHLTHGPFYADIIPDRHDRNLWMYVVQREGSADVLGMGACDSERTAREVARNRMRDLAANDNDAAAATAV